MSENPLLTSSSSLLAIWMAVLGAALVFSITLSVLPSSFRRARAVLFAIAAIPVVAVLALFAIRGFLTLERPIVHWIFDREDPLALRFGMTLDPIAWIASFSFGVALYGTTIRNRPNVRLVAAAMAAWVGLAWVASAKTAWTALLGIAVQLAASVLPLLPTGETTETEGSALADDRWVSIAKRNGVALACALAGATGLVSLGVHLDFSPDQAWTKLEETYPSFVAAALFLLGFVLFLTPAFSSRAMHVDASTTRMDASEERFFVFEGAIGWSAAIVLYRLHDCLNGTLWPMAISIAAAVAALLSLLSLVFHDLRRNAAVQWNATLPALAAAVLPLLSPREAFLFLAALLPIAAGLMICFESPRTKAGTWASGFFFLGACGFVGWTSSSGLAAFYSGLEATPALQGSIALLWFFFCAAGWRIVLRGKTDEKETAPVVVGISLGILALLAFGPAISGRWSGGSLPEAPDWIATAKTWPWLERFSDAGVETNWLGFAASQAVWFLGVLVGSFAWGSSALFPFPEKGGRGREIVSGIFGAYWLVDRISLGLETVGRFWTERVSAPLWEKLLPSAVSAFAASLARMGQFFERVSDPITSSVYGGVVRAPAKFVRWLHGGNARLYGWFALVWILIFSLYLTRS